MPAHRTSRPILSRTWMPLVTVLAVAGAGLGMWKVHQFSEPGPVPQVNAPQAPEQFNPKRLTYQVFGVLGDGGMLSYVDIEGHPHSVELTALPWEHEETTMLTVASGSVSVQVHGGEVGCRILVDGVVRDEHTVAHADADVACRVKSA